MATYTPQAWVNGAAGGTPLSAPRLTTIETGLSEAFRFLGSVHAIDSFPGADDNAKFGAALTYAAAQTLKPTLMFPGRLFGPLTTTRAPFSGMKLMGPPGNEGCKNLEIASNSLVNHRVRVQTGTGTSSLFVQSGDLNDVNLANIAFSGSASSQFWHQSSGQIYPGQWHSLSFDGFQHVMGSPATKFTCTQFVTSGHWTVLNYTNTPITIGGSDNLLWMGGFLNSNSPASVAGTGKPIIILDFCEKTDVGYCYITAENDWTGMRILGAQSRPVRIFGGTYEGRSASNTATRPVLEVQSGVVTVFGAGYNFVTSTANSNGAIHQSGGRLKLISPSYMRASAAAATFPLLYQTGGTALVYQPDCGTTGEQVRVRWSTGTVDTANAPSNSMVS